MRRNPFRRWYGDRPRGPGKVGEALNEKLGDYFKCKARLGWMRLAERRERAEKKAAARAAR